MSESTSKLLDRAQSIVDRKPNNTKLDETLIQVVVAMTLQGATAKSMAQGMMVSDRTFRNWMRRGAKCEGDIYEKFYLAVKSAESETALEAVTTWRAYHKHDWRSAKAFLESRWPEDWGKDRKRSERPQVPTPQPIVINVTLAPGMSLPDAVPREYLPLVSVIEPRAIEVQDHEGDVDG